MSSKLAPYSYSAFLTWDGDIGAKTIGFDAVVSETHEKTMTPMQHSVESGVDIVDHVVPEPLKVTLEAYVTQTPIDVLDHSGKQAAFFTVTDLDPYLAPYPSSFSVTSLLPGKLMGSAINGLKGLLAGKKTNSAKTYTFKGGARNFLREVHDILTALMDKAELITVWTENKHYENMLLLDISVSRTPDKGGAAMFSLSFQQVRIAKSGKAKIPKEKIAKPTESKGAQNPKQTKTEESIGIFITDAGANAAGYKATEEAVRKLRSPNDVPSIPGVGGL